MEESEEGSIHVPDKLTLEGHIDDTQKGLIDDTQDEHFDDAEEGSIHDKEEGNIHDAEEGGIDDKEEGSINDAEEENSHDTQEGSIDKSLNDGTTVPKELDKNLEGEPVDEQTPVDWFEPLEDDGNDEWDWEDPMNGRRDVREESIAGESERSSIGFNEKKPKKKDSTFSLSL